MEERQAEIEGIISWMSGYIFIMSGHPTLKEEIKRLEELVFEAHRKSALEEKS